MNTPFAPKLPNLMVVEFESHRKLSWKERLQILLGYNLLTKVKVLVDRRHTNVRGKAEVHLTKAVDATEQIREDIKR